MKRREEARGAQGWRGTRGMFGPETGTAGEF